MTGRFRIVKTAGPWRKALSFFRETPQDDVYFRYHYAALYAGPGASAEAFHYAENGNHFFFSYLVRPLPGFTLADRMFDIETPYGYGGPISTSMDKRFLAGAWNSFSRYCQQTGIIAGFIRFHPVLNTHKFVAGGFVKTTAERKTIIVDLSQDREAVWAQYKSTTRNRIRKSEKAGVSVKAESGRSALEKFGRFYQTRMKELCAHRDYRFAADYFDSISSLGANGYRVYIAEIDGKEIGGYLILLSDRYAHYHLGSASQRYSYLCPTNKLMHEVIMNLAGGTRETLHLGGGMSSSPADPLLRFKAGYSPGRAQFRFGSFVSNARLYRTICEDWESRNPHLVERFGARVLKYRYE